jgi:lysophospholipase L1-like esterase
MQTPRRFSFLKPAWLSLVACAVMVCSATGWAAEAPGKSPTDAMLPGRGPAQKGDWFDQVWTQRRAEFRKSATADQGAVVFLGDSITQGWSDLAAQFPKYHCANRGISGDTTRGVLFRLQGDVLGLKPAAVVLLIGTNDIGIGATPEEVAENVRAILAALKAANPKMLVIVCKVMPSSASKQRPADKIQKLNALVDEVVKADVQFARCDTYSIFADQDGDAKKEEFPDLLHPNAAGYAKWAAAVKPVLKILEPVDAPVLPAGPDRR